MKAQVITLFPEMFEPLKHSIPKKAIEKGKFQLELIQLRNFALNAYGQVDDYPYGGEPGLVLRPEPLADAIASLGQIPPGTPIVYTTPQGKVFDQNMAKEWADHKQIVFICGHYKGIDERIIEKYVTHEVSIGDFVLSGGELPTMVMLDAVIRLLPGVIGDFGSAESDSHYNGLLGWPVYTRPENWQGMQVPPILLSGHHAKIQQWRQEQAEIRTLERRPDLAVNIPPKPNKKRKKS
jgi:tRNA (guanine37-N1)-methyltransferase